MSEGGGTWEEIMDDCEAEVTGVKRSLSLRVREKDSSWEKIL